MQVTKIPYCTGVMMSAGTGSGNMYGHMVMALFTYHLSNVSNLHLILGNLLFVGFDVNPWPRAQRPWSWVPVKSLLTSMIASSRRHQ